MITHIEVENVRGVTGSIDLSQRTLLTGPMASGKSAYVVGLDFLLLGCVPGSKPTELFNNALGDSMRAKATINGREVERWMQQGKTLSDSLGIDGNIAKISKGSDKAMIGMALGKKPLLFDIHAFWDATGTERRKIVLGMVAGQEELAALLEAEEKARTKSKALTADRQAAEKAVQQLSRELAEMEKPAGSLDIIEAEIVELKKALDDAKDKVRSGQANDRARAAIASSRETLPALQSRKTELKAKAAQLVKARGVIEKEIAAFQEKEKPQEPNVKYPNMPEGAQEEIRGIIAKLHELPPSTDPDTGQVIMEECIMALADLIPDKEAMAEWIEAKSAYDKEFQRLNMNGREKDSHIAGLESEIKTVLVQIEACEGTLAKEDAIGPGLDQNDVATVEGFTERLTGLEAQAGALRKIKVRSDAIEGAKLEADKCSAMEKDAKAAIEAALDAQRKVVAEGEELLATRSKEFLPKGNLRIVDEGRTFDVCWAKTPELRVSRSTLSGGEQCIFDAALAHALAPEALVVIEAAEMDDGTLGKFLSETAACEYQMLVLTCHPLEDVPEGWTHLQLLEVE